MLRSVRLPIYVYAHLNVRYIDYNSMTSYEIQYTVPGYGKFEYALLTLIKFIMHKRVGILDS